MMASSGWTHWDSAAFAAFMAAVTFGAGLFVRIRLQRGRYPSNAVGGMRFAVIIAFTVAAGASVTALVQVILALA